MKTPAGRRPDQALFISDTQHLRYFFVSEFTRVYFGNEFCADLLPTPRQIAAVMAFCRRQGVAFTFVTPVLFQSAMERVTDLLDLLPRGTEVVLNDLGLCAAAAARGLTAVHGRLLCTAKKDPRIPAGSEAFGYFRTHNIQHRYQAWLKSMGIRRVEFDNVVQGLDVDLGAGLSASLYYPYVPVTVSRDCIFSPRLRRGKGGRRGVRACGASCRTGGVKGSLDGFPVDVVGNAVFYTNARRPDPHETAHVDRFVYMPKIPNTNSFENDLPPLDWEHVHRHCDTNRLWGDAPDRLLGEIVGAQSLPRRAHVLDVGCGTGRHAALFEETGCRYTGIDISRLAAAGAAKRFPRHRFIRGDFLEFAGFASAFDLVVDYGCFHAIPPWKRPAYAARVLKALKRGGTLVIVAWSLKPGEPGTAPILFVGDGPPEWGCTPGELSALFGDVFDVSPAGGKVVGTRTLEYFVCTPKKKRRNP